MAAMMAWNGSSPRASSGRTSSAPAAGALAHAAGTAGAADAAVFDAGVSCVTGIAFSGMFHVQERHRHPNASRPAGVMCSGVQGGSQTRSTATHSTPGNIRRIASSTAVLSFTLQDEIARLRSEPAWQRGERNAITLTKGPDFRVILTVMKTGARIQEHHVDARLTLQILAGRVRFALPDESRDLVTGQLLALDSGIAHDIEALEESAFLLTIAWPGGQGQPANR
jgi:quercetin dioxygenase-like cupin family protein